MSASLLIGSFCKYSNAVLQECVTGLPAVFISNTFVSGVVHIAAIFLTFLIIYLFFFYFIHTQQVKKTRTFFSSFTWERSPGERDFLFEHHSVSSACAPCNNAGAVIEMSGIIPQMTFFFFLGECSQVMLKNILSLING